MSNDVFSWLLEKAVSLWQGFPSICMRDSGIELLLGVRQKTAMLENGICNAVHCVCPCG